MCVQDAMGRWYCCNDSYVTLSSLQDVLSEKVYILFFSRANQRPVSASTISASNRIKSCESNGSEASKSPRATVPLKAVPTKSYVEQSSRKDIPAVSKVDKVPSSQRIKFNIFDNSGSKRVLPTVGGKVDTNKSRNTEMNGDVKDSVCVEKLDKDVSSAINRNGSNKNKEVNAVDGETCQAFSGPSENGFTQNGAINSVKQHLYHGNGTVSKVQTGKGIDHHELQNGDVNGHLEISGSKRKLKDTCILFAQDAESHAEVEELKEAYVTFYLSCFKSFLYLIYVD